MLKGFRTILQSHPQEVYYRILSPHNPRFSAHTWILREKWWVWWDSGTKISRKETNISPIKQPPYHHRWTQINHQKLIWKHPQRTSTTEKKTTRQLPPKRSCCNCLQLLKFILSWRWEKSNFPVCWSWVVLPSRYLGKKKYFTNLDFPEIKGFPLLNHHLGPQVVWGRYNLTRRYETRTQTKEWGKVFSSSSSPNKNYRLDFKVDTQHEHWVPHIHDISSCPATARCLDPSQWEVQGTK